MSKPIILVCLVISSVWSIQIVSNNKEIINQEPKLLATVKNGQKYLIGDLNDP